MRGPAALRLLAARATAARRTLRSAVATALLNPLLYLGAMGLGIGAVVAPEQAAALPGGSYLAFVGPGLLVATAMQIAASESMWPLMAGIEWRKTYHAVAATPLRPVDITLGHLGFGVLRVAVSSVIVAAVLVVAVPAIGPAGGGLAVLAAVAVGAAFAAPILALTARLRSHVFLASLMRFGIVPLFLFSGTFFPIDRLPEVVQPVAAASPLWHGAELARAAALGVPAAWSLTAHIAVLVVLTAAGIVAGERAMRAVLHP